MIGFIFKVLILFSACLAVAYQYTGFEQHALLGIVAIIYLLADIIAFNVSHNEVMNEYIKLQREKNK